MWLSAKRSIKFSIMLTATTFMAVAVVCWTPLLVASFFVLPLHPPPPLTTKTRSESLSLYTQAPDASFSTVGMNANDSNDDIIINGSDEDDVSSFSTISNNDHNSISDDAINGSNAPAAAMNAAYNDDPLPVHTALQSPAGLLCDIEDDTTHTLPHRSGGETRKRVLVLCTGGTLVCTIIFISQTLVCW
jgi:hypothetical protein